MGESLGGNSGYIVDKGAGAACLGWELWTDTVVGPVPSLCFPPGQEAAVQHDAFPGVGQLCFLSLPGGGSRLGELEPLQRLGGLLPH